MSSPESVRSTSTASASAIDWRVRYTLVSPIVSPRSRSSAWRSCAGRSPLDSSSRAEIALRGRVDRTPMGLSGVVIALLLPGVPDGRLDDVEEMSVQQFVAHLATLPMGGDHPGR